MIVGGYSLHLYCDNGPKCLLWPLMGNVSHSEFDGDTERECRKEARKDGWTFKRDRKTGAETCYCKRCNSK